jgi:single-strand DNA-binding protein
MSYQLTVIVGNLGRDAELRFTPGGQAVCNFSVATTRTYPGADGELKKETTWFRVTVWGKQAENCNTYLHKGDKVLIQDRRSEALLPQ